MADRPFTEDKGLGVSRLWWWICFSGTLHILIIVTLFLVPSSTARRRVPHPVYTVDLVGGGGLEGELSPTSPSKEPPPAPETVEESAIESDEIDDPVSVLPPPETPEPRQPQESPEPVIPKSEKVTEPEVVEAIPPKKPQEVEKKELKKKPTPEKKKEAAKKPKKVKKKKPKKVVRKKSKPVPKRIKKTKAKRDEVARQRLREKRIQAAVAKAQERAARRRRSSANGRGNSPSQVARVGGARGPGKSTGVGDGTGRGGGVVKGLEFVVYRNRMLNQIKNRWTWIGKRNDLEVTVRFGVDSDGRVFALEVVGASGDSSYDDSVVRAVKRASPLPPPPANYLGDFSDVELTFRPRDLDG